MISAPLFCPNTTTTSVEHPSWTQESPQHHTASPADTIKCSPQLESAASADTLTPASPQADPIGIHDPLKVKFPLKTTLIGARKTPLVFSSTDDSRDNTLLLCICRFLKLFNCLTIFHYVDNLILLRGAVCTIPETTKELSLDQLLYHIEKAFMEYDVSFHHSALV